MFSWHDSHCCICFAKCRKSLAAHSLNIDIRFCLSRGKVVACSFAPWPCHCCTRVARPVAAHSCELQHFGSSRLFVLNHLELPPSMARLSDTESEDWMAEPGRPFAAATKAASKASVPKGAAFPVAAEAGAGENLPWRGGIGRSPSQLAVCQVLPLVPRTRTQSATRLTWRSRVQLPQPLPKKGQKRLRRLCGWQLWQQSKWPSPLLHRSQLLPRSAVLSCPQWRSRPSSHRVTQCSSNKPRAAPRARKSKDETDGPKPKKARAAWGSVGCFAGRRPPTDDESKESFELKRKLWSHLGEEVPGQAYERRGDKDGFAGGLLVLLARP